LGGIIFIIDSRVGNLMGKTAPQILQNTTNTSKYHYTSGEEVE